MISGRTSQRMTIIITDQAIAIAQLVAYLSSPGLSVSADSLAVISSPIIERLKVMAQSP